MSKNKELKNTPAQAYHQYTSHPTGCIEKSTLNIQTLTLLSFMITHTLPYPKDMGNSLGIFFPQKI